MFHCLILFVELTKDGVLSGSHADTSSWRRTGSPLLQSAGLGMPFLMSSSAKSSHHRPGWIDTIFSYCDPGNDATTLTSVLSMSLLVIHFEASLLHELWNVLSQVNNEIRIIGRKGEIVGITGVNSALS